MDRILVIRGGAIGDFLLTLPALKALREAWRQAHIEILGYTHIVVLAENRFYAQAVRSIESGQLSKFFATNSELPSEFADYFGSFDLIISYLYDPDSIFATNLRRCGIKHLLCGPARMVQTGGHAARQLARPIEHLGIKVFDLSERLFLSAEDRQFAREFLRPLQKPVLTIHPGSGSKEKNWPLEHWIALAERTHGSTENFGSLIVVCGEADEAQRQQLERQWNSSNIRFAYNLPLPQLAALLEKSVFIGHDSGISHLAAAAGANCILLFGPTDPDVWAPHNSNVQVIRAPNRRLSDLEIERVEAAVRAALRSY
ncbi:MAG TPA: glycosyltransferase family 9 protein [Candidatus Udaeobacter sp.]|nr:glycosyltransferase family 9 protein [Candidatus Udaeobacter sp.]